MRRLLFVFLVSFLLCFLNDAFHYGLHRPCPSHTHVHCHRTTVAKIQRQALLMSTDGGNSGKERNNDHDVEDEDDEKPKPFKGFSKKKEEEITKEVQKTKEEVLADQRLEGQIRSTKMFEKKRAREESELDAKIAAVRAEEELIASDPSVGAVPEVGRHCCCSHDTT